MGSLGRSWGLSGCVALAVLVTSAGSGRAAPETGRVAVPPFDSEESLRGVAATVEALATTELGRVSGNEVISGRDVEHILSQEQLQQLLGCADGARQGCGDAVDDIAEVERLVWGRVGKLGDLFIVTLTLIDSQHGRVVRRVTRQARIESSLPTAVNDAIAALWVDTTLPHDGCVDCDETREPPFIGVSLMLGNNFVSLLSGGSSVSLLAPAFDLDVGVRLGGRYLLSIGAGIAFASGSDGGNDVSFQVVPVDLNLRVLFDVSEDVSLYPMGGIGVGFVRAALSGQGGSLETSFSAALGGGLVWRFWRWVGLQVELAYELTTDTPSQVRSQPLGAAALQLGLTYGY